MHLLDESLEAMFRAVMPATTGDIDYSFDRPDTTWRTSVTKPTLNFHLWEVRPVPGEAQAGWALVEENGRTVRRQALPRIAFRYHVSAWTTDTRDQHQLLGAVLAAVLQHQTIPVQYLHAALQDAQPPPALKLGTTEFPDANDIWSGLQHGMQASLDLIATLSIDAAKLAEVGPPTTGIVIEVSDKEIVDRRSTTREVAGLVADPAAAGAVVRSPRGSTRVGPDGRFAVPAEPGDAIVVETAPPLVGVAPDAGTVALSQRAETEQAP
jgi:hypothetical protein